MVLHAGVKRFSRPLRMMALVLMFFFAWTLGGFAGLAQAAKLNKTQRPSRDAARGKAAEERLEALLERMEAELSAPITGMKALRQSLKVKRDEIETLDDEIRQQFAATAQKLKAARLPNEILRRHEQFVRHYDENLQQLKENLSAIEKADTPVAATPAVERARAHLHTTKPSSRHQPLDPNKLPFRQPKAQKREPRMKKEEFQRDIKREKNAWRNEKPILVATNGSLAGLLSPDGLAETIEVQFTPEIQAKAEELENNPVKIYDWVRNNIEFVPTWGSIQGAQLTLETGQGNAFDTASLLIALLRAAGIESRYVTGTIELPIVKVMNWGGDFTDPMSALDFFSSGGIPTKGLVSAGQIVGARMEHVWVEAYIDYIPSRGAKHRQGDTWISLDPSFKQYTYTEGIDFKSAVPFNAQFFLDQVQASATIDDTQGYATGVDSLLVQQTIQDYQTRVQNYIEENFPEATVDDFLGMKATIKQEFPYLLGTLPYRTAVRGAIFTAIPDSYRHKLSFHVENEVTSGTFVDPTEPTPADTSLRLTKSLPELAGKKITLSYSPATVQDEGVLEAYLPKPHADGTPIQPNELPSSLPAYLINVKPELRIDGQVVATGAPVGLGGTNIFTMTFSDPSYGSSQITNYIDAGAYLAIGLNLGKISQKQLEALKEKLVDTKTKIQNQDFTGLTKDDLLGDLLYTTALAYHAELSTTNFIASRTMKVNAIILPSETSFSTQLNVLCLWGIPRKVSIGGLCMDADYLMNVVKAKDGNREIVKEFMLSTGITSSELEHKIPEQLFSTSENQGEGISAVKALHIANDQGIPIYSITKANISTVLPQLQIEQQVKDDIQNAINSGKEVIVSKNNVNFNGWAGCGYIIIDPDTGSGAYMISGGQNGAWYVLWWIGYTILLTLRAAGMVAIAWLAAIVLGPYIFAIESIIASVIVASAGFLVRCVKKAINNGTAVEALRQICDIPKRINNALPDPVRVIVSVGLQLLKIWSLTCGQPG